MGRETGWGCWTLAALIREALGQRRVGVAVRPLFNTITTTTVVIIIISYDVSYDDYATVVITVNGLYLGE